MRYATQHGFSIRFDTKLLSFEQESSGTILSRIKDHVAQVERTVRSKYLFGADGGRSKVLESTKIPLITKPGGGAAFNCLVTADLSRHMDHRAGILNEIVQPDADISLFGLVGVARMIKPWNEWQFLFLPHPSLDPGFVPSIEQCTERIKQWIGDETIPVTVHSVSKWMINEKIAERYSSGNV